MSKKSPFLIIIFMGRGDDQSTGSAPARRGSVVSRESFETRTFEEDGVEITETRNDAGQLHSPDPAKAARTIFQKDDNGYSRSEKEWYENGQKTRSELEINDSDFDHPEGSTSQKMTYDAEGELHSFNGQPSRSFSEAAGFWQEEYHQHGQLVKTESSDKEAAEEEAREADSKDGKEAEEYKRLFADTVRQRAERVMRDKEKRVVANEEDKEEWTPAGLEEGIFVSSGETVTSAVEKEGKNKPTASERRTGLFSRFLGRSKGERARDSAPAREKKKSLSDLREGSNEWQELYREEDPAGYQAWLDWSEESYDGDQDGQNT